MSSFYHEYWWQAGVQRLLAFLKDSPTYSEMPLQGCDMVPPVRFVGKFCSRTFCGFRENIPRQPVRNPVVADVHGPVDVGFISCRNRMQHQLIFPALDRRVFFALNLVGLLLEMGVDRGITNAAGQTACQVTRSRQPSACPITSESRSCRRNPDQVSRGSSGGPPRRWRRAPG